MGSWLFSEALIFLKIKAPTFPGSFSFSGAQGGWVWWGCNPHLFLHIRYGNYKRSVEMS
jgi:hypothetical protein